MTYDEVRKMIYLWDNMVSSSGYIVSDFGHLHFVDRKTGVRIQIDHLCSVEATLPDGSKDWIRSNYRNDILSEEHDNKFNRVLIEGDWVPLYDENSKAISFAVELVEKRIKCLESDIERFKDDMELCHRDCSRYCE